MSPAGELSEQTDGRELEMGDNNNTSNSASSAGNGRSSGGGKQVSPEEQALRALHAKEMESVSLLRSPVFTTRLLLAALVSNAKGLLHWLSLHRMLVSAALLLGCCYVVLRSLDGAHQPQIAAFEFYVSLAAWWIGLGILSSVGLGIPHTHKHANANASARLLVDDVVLTSSHRCRNGIAHVRALSGTVHCEGHAHSHRMPQLELYAVPHSLTRSLTEPPSYWSALTHGHVCELSYGEGSFVCPATAGDGSDVAFLSILLMVQAEAMLWGLGTAIGELPPYFIARAGPRETLSTHSWITSLRA